MNSRLFVHFCFCYLHYKYVLFHHRHFWARAHAHRCLFLAFIYRVLELSFIFLLVWYYCTLTIRESILKVNGSRIKGWWRAHHFISTVCAGILLIWPQGEPWLLFRNQFMYFNAYISMVQFLQFRYQRGVLYRLKALGERHDMDITIEGFHSWMWRGLSFLLPFLFAGYMFQAYNSYALWKLSSHPDASWQVIALSILFFMLFVGNTLTTLLVIPEKIFTRVNEHYRLLALAKKKKVSSMEPSQCKPIQNYAVQWTPPNISIISFPFFFNSVVFVTAKVEKWRESVHGYYHMNQKESNTNKTPNVNLFIYE